MVRGGSAAEDDAPFRRLSELAYGATAERLGVFHVETFVHCQEEPAALGLQQRLYPRVATQGCGASQPRADM